MESTDQKFISELRRRAGISPSPSVKEALNQVASSIETIMSEPANDTIQIVIDEKDKKRS